MSATSKWAIFGFLYGAAIFVLSPSFQKLIDNPGFWNAKEQLLYLTGSVAMIYMVISMVLSVRIERISNLAGGLDKAYIVHKWIGVYALVFSIFHWIVKEGPKVLAALDLVPPKVKSGGASPYTDFGKALYGFGNDMAEIAFYIILAILAISLLKKIPYHIFRLVHKIIPPLFLMIAFHAGTIQIKGQWFGSAGSVLLWIIIIAGSAAAFIDMSRIVVKKRRTKAVVSGIEYDEKSGIMDIRLSLTEKNFKYSAGQYVFLKFGFFGEPHPFSIASYDKEMKEIRFLIKELGDFTGKLAKTIKKGDPAIVEGAYGGFTFRDECQRQIWIAGGIGVTPFMSRLEYLASEGKGNKPVDFFYSARGESPLKKDLEEMCQKAGVNFHYTDTSKTGRLTVNGIKEKVKNPDGASVWYCGPAAFCAYLKKTLKESGLKAKLHYDSFEMR